MVMLNETDPEQFEKLSKGFINRFAQVCPEFVSYFDKGYINTEKFRRDKISDFFLSEY